MTSHLFLGMQNIIMGKINNLILKDIKGKWVDFLPLENDNIACYEVSNC